MYGESYSKSPEFNAWGAPVLLQANVPLVPMEGITLFHNVMFYREV